MIDRPEPLHWLSKWKDREPVKTITGVRRCGKSTLLALFRERLARDGVPAGRIVAMNFEHPDFAGIRTDADLMAWLRPKLAKGATTYVFLDEIQRVEGFERAVDGLHAMGGADVYITGSNAYLLSGELATYLTGRYVELHLFPFSFREWFEGHASVAASPERVWADYLRFSTFPHDPVMHDDPHMVDDWLDGIYNSVLRKDVIARHRFRAPAVLDAVTRFLFDNVGNATSLRNIAATLAGEGVRADAGTVEEYVDALCEAFLVYKATPIDVRGRELLKTGAKYYAVDPGLRRFLLGGRPGDSGRILENVVFLELRRRHREVRIGRLGTREIDFVVRDGGDVRYYQVAESARDERTRERELAPLLAIPDHCPKTVLTLDVEPPASERGVRFVNALDFLLGRA